MEIKVNRPSISELGFELEHLASDSMSVAQKSALQVLNGAYSSVSGLNQLGAGHGGVLAGGMGDARTILESYSEQIQWLGKALEASVNALSGQDQLFAQGMDIADVGGSIQEESVMLPARPAPRFHSFVFAPPVVLPALSINQLSNDFSGTNSGAVSEAQSSWNSMASMITEVTSGLSRVAAQLLANNSGEVFEQAASRITEVAEAGSTFALNAQTMAQSVGTLNRIYQSHRTQVLMAQASISAIVEPAERLAAETAFLGTFATVFQGDVISGMPPINNLMRMQGSDGSGGDIALGMSEIAGSGPAHSAEGIVPQGGGVFSEISGVGSVSAGSLSAVNGVVEELGIGETATSAASISSSSGGISSPFSNALSSTQGSGSLNGATGTSGIGRHALGNGVSGFMLPTPGGMASRTQGASASSGVSPGLASAGGGSAGVVPGATKLGSKQATPAAGSGQSSAASLGNGGASRLSTSAGKTMMPMMPMAGVGAGAGGGGRSGRGKVKSVTSAVEEDRNIAALLGDRGAVVPGVIGDWVRG